MDHQSLANAIFELTSVMPVRTEPRFPQRKEVEPEIRKAILRPGKFFAVFQQTGDRAGCGDVAGGNR